jgi:acyl-coenzyme A thioesterase PaaI-like protein
MVAKDGLLKVRHPGDGCYLCASGFWGFFDEKKDFSFFEIEFEKEKHQGPPGFVHGGVIATYLDEAMSFATFKYFPAFLVRFEIEYRKPVPLGKKVIVEGKVVDARGRKIFTEGAIKDGDTILIYAKGLYIQPKFIRKASIEIID